MPKTQPVRPSKAARSKLSFAIVASQYNLRYVEALVQHARRELDVLEPGAPTTVFWVPGSFEIPLTAKLIAARQKYDAVLALGLIFQGETEHARLIAQSVTIALQNIALEFHLPIIHEVLLLTNERQAQTRCLGKKFNRGVEAARAAVVSARAVHNLKK